MGLGTLIRTIQGYGLTIFTKGPTLANSIYIKGIGIIQLFVGRRGQSKIEWPFATGPLLVFIPAIKVH